MNKITQYNKGWLASMLDGEGCIGLYLEKTRWNTIITIVKIAIRVSRDFHDCGSCFE